MKEYSQEDEPPPTNVESENHCSPSTYTNPPSPDVLLSFTRDMPRLLPISSLSAPSPSPAPSLFAPSALLGLVFRQLLQDGQGPYDADVLQDVHGAIALLSGTLDVPEGVRVLGRRSRVSGTSRRKNQRSAAALH